MAAVPLEQVEEPENKKGRTIEDEVTCIKPKYRLL
jgi:hypothetical protein